MESQGAAISLRDGGQVIAMRNPHRPQVTVTALSSDMRSSVTLVLTLAERDRLVAALQGEEGGV